MFAMEKMNDAINKSYPENRDMPDPSYNNLLQPIPQCEEFSVRQPCYDFVWSGESLDSKRRVQRIVDAIMANNPGRPIPPAKVCLIHDCIKKPMISLLMKKMRLCTWSHWNPTRFTTYISRCASCNVCYTNTWELGVPRNILKTLASIISGPKILCSRNLFLSSV